MPAAPKPGEIHDGYRFTGGDPKDQASWQPLQGDEFLKTLNPVDAGVIRQMVEGRMAPPTSFALKTPFWQEKIYKAQQYDPSFDETTWPGRVATRKDFASGKSAQGVTSLNTVMGHLKNWYDAMQDLNTSDLTPLNYAENLGRSLTSNPKLVKVREAQTALTNELTRSFRGSGGSGDDIRTWQENLSQNLGPTGSKQAALSLLDLLGSRMDALGDQYSRGMGKETPPVQLLSPKAQKIYTDFVNPEEQTDAVPSPTLQLGVAAPGTKKVGRFSVQEVTP